jgi:hypothetical protein
MSATTPEVQYHDPIRTYLETFIKDDDDLLEHNLVVCFSSFTSNPLNLGVMAPTSEGKSYTISLVTGLFPNAVVFTGSSSKAFFYEEGKAVDPETHEDLQGRMDALRSRLDDDDKDGAARSELRQLNKRAMIRVNLEGRILVFLEPPEIALFEALKPILSHDKWESLYQTVDRSSSGEQRTKKILLVGWPTMIFASAKDQDTWSMWPELQSRCVIVSPNMTQEKYLQANRLTSKLLGLPSFVLKNLFPEDLEVAAREEVRRVKQAIELTRMLGGSEGGGSHRDNFVLNPFAEQLNELFPHESGLRMRQFRSLMSYVNILAMIAADQRPKLVVKGQARAVVATASDVERAMKLVFSSTWASIPRYKVDFYEQAVLGAYEGAATVIGTGDKVEKRYHAVPTKEILAKARSLNFKMGPNRLRKTFLEPLEEAGLLSSEQDPDDKRGLAWTPIQIAQKYGRLGERRSFEPESVRRALKSVSDGLGDLIPNYSYPDGLLVSDLGEFVSYLIGGKQEEGTATGSSVSKLYDDARKAISLTPMDDYGHTEPPNLMTAAAMIDRGLTPFGYKETDPEEGGGEGVDPSSHTTPDTDLGRVPEAQGDPLSGAKEKRGVEENLLPQGTPTPPPSTISDKSGAHLIVRTCSECGKPLEVGGNYVWQKKPVCREHYLGHAKEAREAGSPEE